MRYVGATVLIWISLSAGASARDIFVNNVAGDDRFTGAATATQGARIGPCRTIARALELAAKGDRIVLAATGEPYRESITLQAGRHSGFGDRPFEIVGGGATLLGTAPVPDAAWEHVGREVYRFLRREEFAVAVSGWQAGGSCAGRPRRPELARFEAAPVVLVPARCVLPHRTWTDAGQLPLGVLRSARGHHVVRGAARRDPRLDCAGLPTGRHQRSRQRV